MTSRIKFDNIPVILKKGPSRQGLGEREPRFLKTAPGRLVSTRGPISRFATGQYEFRRPTETAVDRSIRYTNAQKVELGEGQIRVDFHNALHGMQTHTGGGGAVRNTRLSQTPQMNTTGSYGTDSANQYAEE